jgi:glycosyltransferase involved in cell wall biosynthesis
VTISVIIASRDRAHLLASTLDALSSQEWPGCPFEILVVDNASVDETRAVVAAAAGHAAPPIVYLREEKPGKSHALNTAAAHARGELLVLTDDDVLPSQGWLRAYVRAFAETGADYAVGRILPLWETPPPRWLSPALYGALAVPDGGTRRLPIAKGVNEHVMPLGANMAVRRHVLDRVGGWNPDLGKLQGTLRTGEDHEFALKMLGAGFTGVYEPDASVHHRVQSDRLRLAYFQRWFYDNGTIEAYLEQNYPSTNQYWLNVPRYLWRQLVNDLFGTASAILTGDMRRLTAREMRLTWFVGYLRGRWKRRKVDAARVAAQPAAIQRS